MVIWWSKVLNMKMIFNMYSLNFQAFEVVETDESVLFCILNRIEIWNWITWKYWEGGGMQFGRGGGRRGRAAIPSPWRWSPPPPPGSCTLTPSRRIAINRCDVSSWTITAINHYDPTLTCMHVIVLRYTGCPENFEHPHSEYEVP